MFVNPARAMASAVVLTMITAGAVQAADIPPPPPPMPYEEIRPGYDWTGFEIGALYAFQGTDNDYQPTPGPDPELNGDGHAGGILVGYNHQMGQFVVGVEGDIMFGTLDPRNSLDQVEQEIDQIATLRARAGWAHDNTLFYVTGGVGWLESEIEIPAFGESDKKTHVGYVVGGGIEHGFTDHLTARLEYLYGDFGKKTYNYTPGIIEADLKDMHMIRGGLAWKF